MVQNYLSLLKFLPTDFTTPLRVDTMFVTDLFDSFKHDLFYSKPPRVFGWTFIDLFVFHILKKPTEVSYLSPDVHVLLSQVDLRLCEPLFEVGKGLQSHK